MPVTQVQYPQSGAAQMAAQTPVNPAQAGASQAQMDENRRRILANSEGRAQQIANDPRQKSAMDYLQGVVGGQNVPYSDTVKNSILAQQGRGSADAEAAQMQSLRDSLGASGGSIYDPGYQAAQRQAMSQRQGQNLDAAGQMEGQAGIANSEAQMRGANSLASISAANNAQQNQMLAQANQFRQNDVAQIPTAPVGAAAGVNNPWALGLPQNRANQGVFSTNAQGLRGLI